MHITRRIFLAVAVAALAAWAWASSPKHTTDWDANALQRKAEYIALEAGNAYAEDRYDDFILLTQRAYSLDSTDLDIAYNWGLAQILTSNDPSTYGPAFQAMLNRYFSDPANFPLGANLAAFAKELRKFDTATAIWEKLDSAFPSMSQPAEELAQAYLISSVISDSLKPNPYLDKALAIYNRLESGRGKSTALSSQKIRAYALHNDTASVIAEVQSLLDFAPEDSYVALFAGANYEYLHDLPQALKYYDRACQLDSTNGRAYIAKADIYLQLNDSAAYDREVFLALNSPNLEVEPKLQILRSYVSKLYHDPTQEPRIRSLFSSLEQIHPGETELHRLYAAYLYEINDKKGMAEELSYAVALEPNDETMWMQLAESQMAASDTIGAQATALQGMERFPSNLYLPIVAAYTYRQQDNLPAAIAVLDSVKIDIDKNPSGSASFITTKGDFCSLAGDTIRAIALYEEAIEIDPANALALNNCAYFMAEHDTDLDKAEMYSSKSLRYDAENPTYLDTYAWIQFKRKEYGLAKTYIDMTLNAYAANAQAATEGEAIEEVEAEAIEEVIEGEAENTIHAEIYEHAGDIYFFNGEREQAIDFWKKALELDPDNAVLAQKVKHGTYFYKK